MPKTHKNISTINPNKKFSISHNCCMERCLTIAPENIFGNFWYGEKSIAHAHTDKSSNTQEIYEWCAERERLHRKILSRRKQRAERAIHHRIQKTYGALSENGSRDNFLMKNTALGNDCVLQNSWFIWNKISVCQIWLHTFIRCAVQTLGFIVCVSDASCWE